MRLGHTGEKSLQALAMQGSVKGASTCNLELDGHDVLDKKRKVKFDTTTHPQKVFLIVFTLIFGILPRLHCLETIGTLSRLLIIYLSDVGYIL